MDLSVAAATVAYPPSASPAREADVRSGGRSAPAVNASTDERLVQARLSPASPEAEKLREEAARKKEASTEILRNPGFTFEYEGKQEVMKVHNGKGVLIYQVPSKGQIALIEAEEGSQRDTPPLRLVA